MKNLKIIRVFQVITFVCIFQISKSQTGIVPVTSPIGGFNIDGFLERQGAAGDWFVGPGGSGPGTSVFSSSGQPQLSLTQYVRDPLNTILDDAFIKAKFSDNPNSYKWSNKKVPAKHDLANSFITFKRDMGGHVWAILAADHFKATGTNYIDFEFLQKSAFKLSDGSFHTEGNAGGRTIGDLVITAALGSNDLSLITIQRWVSLGTGKFGYVSVIPAPGTVYSSVNTISIGVPSFMTNGSPFYEPGSFIEIAIDMTSLGALVIDNCGNNIARSYSTLWVKTKSSLSQNTNLVDFLLLQLSDNFVEGPPPEPINTTYQVTADFVFYDLFTAQLTASVAPGTVDDYNFLWEPVGAIINEETNPKIDPSITGSLNDYSIYNPVFKPDPDFPCLGYLYYVNLFRKTDGCIVARTSLVIASYCKIGKPINPDIPNLETELLKEETKIKSDILVYPNPSKGISKILIPASLGAVNIELININGIVIQKWKDFKGESINLNKLPGGLYLLKFKSAVTGDITVKKIIIEN